MDDIINKIIDGKITDSDVKLLLSGIKKPAYEIHENGSIYFYNLRKCPIILFPKEIDEIINIYQSINK
jgi:hypothetical protein